MMNPSACSIMHNNHKDSLRAVVLVLKKTKCKGITYVNLFQIINFLRYTETNTMVNKFTTSFFFKARAGIWKEMKENEGDEHEYGIKSMNWTFF